MGIAKANLLHIRLYVCYGGKIRRQALAFLNFYYFMRNQTIQSAIQHGYHSDTLLLSIN